MLRSLCASVLVLVALVSVGPADEKENETKATIGRLLRRSYQRSGRGDYDGALADIAKVLELDPKSADAYNHRGTVSYNQARYADALSDYSKAIELNPNLDEAYVNRGKTRYEMQDYKPAIADGDKAIELAPENPFAWHLRGRGHFAAGNLLTARADFEKALALDPKFHGAWLNRGHAHLMLGKVENAIGDCTKAIELAPDRAHYYNMRGLARGMVDDLEGAVADLTQTINLDPKMAAAYENRWLAYARLGNDEAAQKDLAENLKLTPNNQASMQALNDKLLPIYTKYPAPKTFDEHLDRGADLMAAGYYYHAAADFVAATEIDDFNPAGFFDLGLALDNLRYYDAAVEAHKKAVKADDRYIKALHELGKLYYTRLNQPEEAIKYLDQALAVKPDYALAMRSRGAAKTAKGDLAGALQDLDKAVQMTPDSVFAWQNRGEALLKQGNLDKAIADLTKAIELDPTSAFSFERRGQAKRQKKDYAGAIADLTAAYNLSKGADILMHRGLAYLESGKPADAQKDFDEAVKLYPAIKPELDQEIEKIKLPAGKAKAK